jgi:cell division protein FtsW (lipid II flippase)
VPIVESDFVYVVFGEELGYVGCGLLLLLYVGLTARGFGIAARARNDFSSLVAIGITACLSLQTLINVGGVTKAIPLTGITLPFISHGGSSLITMLLMMGLLMAISEPEPP